MSFLTNYGINTSGNLKTSNWPWRYGKTIIYPKMVSESSSNRISLYLYPYRFDDGETIIEEEEFRITAYPYGYSLKTVYNISIIPMGTGKFFICITTGTTSSPTIYGFILTVPIKVYPTLIGEEFDGVALSSASNGASVQVSVKF